MMASMPPQLLVRVFRSSLLFGSGLVLLAGCARGPKIEPFDLQALVPAGAEAETMPSLGEAAKARRVLVLPLADRAAPARVGRIHNALDDLIRRDLMCVPDLAVFPQSASTVSPIVSLAQDYRSLQTAVEFGQAIGATHVVIGEVAAAGEVRGHSDIMSTAAQVAVEIDLVDVEAERVVGNARIQAPEKKLHRELPKLREAVVRMFGVEPETLNARVPGFTPPVAALAHCGRAQNFAALDDHSQALVEFYEAAKLETPYPDAYLGIASTQVKLGGYDLANGAFQIALSQDPDNPEAYWRYALMIIQHQTADANAALALCQQANRRAPFFGAAHLTLGTLWFDDHRLDHADEHFALAEALLPKSVWPIYNRGGVRRMEGDAAGARALYERALELAPNEPRIHVELAQLLQEAGEQEAALEHFKSAAELDQANPAYLYYVAEQYRRLGDKKRALAAYRAAAAYSFQNAWLSRQLGEAFLAFGELTDAERTLADGYVSSPHEPALGLLYARVLVALARDNRVRRRDYTSRAANVIENLDSVDLTDDQRAEAQRIMAQVDDLTR